MRKRLLVIDDEQNMRHMLHVFLTKLDYEVVGAENGQAGLSLMQESSFDFVLCDIKMPVLDGMSFLQEVNKQKHETTVIMMSAFGTMDSAIEAMQLGAYDYISKPFKPDEIHFVLKKAEEREKLRTENKKLRQELIDIQGKSGFKRMVGKSEKMQKLFQLAVKVAQHPTTVLITGDSGTGKELLARAIHQASPRKEQLFIAVNCGGIPENLLESELFGYAKGAFTGADRDKDGLFSLASGGTLFLDEIGELPLAMQVKLLRVLQEQEVQPLGCRQPHSVDVRVLAATSRDMAQEVAKGRFREDLFFRLNVINLHIPPLAERLEDLPLLCDHFITKFKKTLQYDVQGVAPASMNLFLQYAWPGNVRELENVLERAVILAEKKMILPENLPDQFGVPAQSRRLDDFFSGFSIKKAQKIMEKSLISRALDATGGNKSKAAELLEISYPALLQKIKSYSLE